MALTQDNYEFKECEVATKHGTRATIPAGRHPTIEDGGAVSIRAGGRQIDIWPDEWKRIVEADYVQL